MPYRLIGSSGSPYSIKVRSYMRFKHLEHKWLVRNTPEVVAEHAEHSKLPIVPTVIQTAQDGTVARVLQDSTPIIEQLEREHPEPAIHPAEHITRFVSELLEEFADEWGNKWMMHYRWYAKTSEPDATAYSRRIATELKSGATLDDDSVREELDGLAEMFKQRMMGRGFTVGSNEITAKIIEESYIQTITMMDKHLATREYILGSRPSMADFGLAGQLGQCLNDATAGELMRLYAPHVALWAEKMVNPCVCGEFEDWKSLKHTLTPLLTSQVSMFLKWSDANHAALAAGRDKLHLQLGGSLWEQKLGGPQRYHSKTLKILRQKFANASKHPEVVDALQETGCLEYLTGQVVPLPSKL